MTTFFLVGVIALFLLVVRNILKIIFSWDAYTLREKRSLEFKQIQKRKTSNTEELIDQLSAPIIRYVLPYLFFGGSRGELERSLKISKWNRYYTVEQFWSIDLLLKFVGVGMFFLVKEKSMMYGIILLVICSSTMGFLLKDAVKTRRDRLFREFPDFVQIMEGFLNAGLPLIAAIEETERYVGDDWRLILMELRQNASRQHGGGLVLALDEMKAKYDFFFIREFTSTMKMVLEQGGDAAEGFAQQADYVLEMQEDLAQAQIANRRLIMTMIQFPLLLCNLVVVAVPIVYSVMQSSVF